MGHKTSLVYQLLSTKQQDIEQKEEGHVKWFYPHYYFRITFCYSYMLMMSGCWYKGLHL